MNNIKPIYKRIILKLSGEALHSSEGFGIDYKILDRIAKEIKELVELNIQVGVVIGGGNLFRGAGLAQAGMNRVVGDHMGMLATVINGLALHDALHRADLTASLMSAIQINGVCDNYSWAEAINRLHNNSVVILVAGTGNPFFTTDSAACLRGIEMGVDAVLKATKVNGVFSHDPDKYSNPTLYERLSYKKVLEKEIKIMDLAAFTLARDHNLLIHVFNINRLGALRRVVIGDKEGTVIAK